MPGAVELVPARALGGGEQAFSGVVPDRVDGYAGLVGELVDAPPRVGHVGKPPVDSSDIESIYSQCSSTGSSSSVRISSRATAHGVKRSSSQALRNVAEGVLMRTSTTARVEPKTEALSWLVSQLRWEETLGELRHVSHDDADDALPAACTQIFLRRAPEP